jgi:hypothetical protein
MFIVPLVVSRSQFISIGGHTGKSLSESLIYSSINPQYDNRLFNDFRVQYKKITRVEHVKNMLFTQIV